MNERLNPYQRIMRASREGKGVVLSSEEAHLMSCDDAIAQFANTCDLDEGMRKMATPLRRNGKQVQP